MKFYSRIILFTIIICAGICLLVIKMYHQFPYKTNNTAKNELDTYKVGYFIGYFTLTILGSLLIIAGVAGLVYTIKKNKDKNDINK